MLFAVIIILGSVAALAYSPIKAQVSTVKTRRDLQRRVREVRINAYNVLSKNWCSGSLVNRAYGEERPVFNPDGTRSFRYGIAETEWVDFDEPQYQVCLEGGILVGAGFSVQALYDFSNIQGVSCINDVLDCFERGDEVWDEDINEYVHQPWGSDVIPATFDAEAAAEAMRVMAHEIEGEARFRALMEHGLVYQGTLVPQLLMINDSESFGREVILEIVRDELWDADPEVARIADEKLTLETTDA